MKIYVASSWRNNVQPSVVAALRAAGHEVYDFKHPAEGDAGFSWREVDPDWSTWTFSAYVDGLKHPAAVRGFNRDMDALNGCDACVLVTPCGRSAHLELGWAVGAHRWTFVLFTEPQEPDLMYAMCTGLVDNVEDLLVKLAAVAGRPR